MLSDGCTKFGRVGCGDRIKVKEAGGGALTGTGGIVTEGSEGGMMRGECIEGTLFSEKGGTVG
jgi:hypothetical protein